MKCTNCSGQLKDFAKIGKVVYYESMEDEHGNLVPCDKYGGSEMRLSICPECFKFHYYGSGPIAFDSDEYYEELEEISISGVVKDLADTVRTSPECIDFKELKEVCRMVGLKFGDVMESIAFEMVNQSKPHLYPIQVNSKKEKAKEDGFSFSEIDDDEIPF